MRQLWLHRKKAAFALKWPQLRPLPTDKGHCFDDASFPVATTAAPSALEKSNLLGTELLRKMQAKETGIPLELHSFRVYLEITAVLVVCTYKAEGAAQLLPDSGCCWK